MGAIAGAVPVVGAALVGAASVVGAALVGAASRRDRAGTALPQVNHV
jgi:hypothetical protein